MQLISIESAKHTAGGGVDLSLTADLGDGAGEQSIPFGWMQGDPHGLGPQVDEWMAAHPDFPIAAADPAPLPPLQPFQFRAMLALSGNQAALDAYVAGLPEPNKTIAQSKLDYSLSFERNNSLVVAAQQAIGLTDAQLDALWAQAATIE